MLNQVSPSQISVGKLDVVPMEDSSSCDIELSSIYNQAETKMKENINTNNVNSRTVASHESPFLISKSSPNLLPSISPAVNNSPTCPSSLFYSFKSGNNSNVSVQTGEVSAISATGIITKSKPALQINKKTVTTSSKSDLSIEIDSNEPLITNISKDTYSTFSFQTLDSNVNTFITSAPYSYGKTKKLDHILELACTIMGDEDIRFQDSCEDINSLVDSSSDYKTNQVFKIHLPPQDEDKKKLLEELVKGMFDNIDDEILEKEFKKSKLAVNVTDNVKPLTTLSVRHKMVNGIQSIEEGKQKGNENGLDNEHELDSKDNSKCIDPIENKIETKNEIANKNNDSFTNNNLKKMEIDIQSIVEFDEQEMLKYLNISKDSFSDCHNFDNSVSNDEISEENCMSKDSDEEIKEYGKHPQWFKRMRNYFHGEGLKIKK